MSNINVEAPVLVRKGYTGQDIGKSMTEGAFGKKSDKFAGKKFWYPDFSMDNVLIGVEWLGLSEVADALTKVYRRVFADIYAQAWEDNTDEKTGITDMAAMDLQMKADWQEFSAGVPKLSEIEDEIQSLTDLQLALTTDDSIGDDPESLMKLRSDMKQIAAKITPLKAKKAEITAKYAARSEKRAAKKEAKEAAAKLAAGTK